jgi:hypothetical protein
VVTCGILVYWIFEGVSRPDCRYRTSGTFGRTGVFEIRGQERALRGRWGLTSFRRGVPRGNLSGTSWRGGVRTHSPSIFLISLRAISQAR